MTDIQMLEVRPGARRATLKFDALDLETFRDMRQTRGSVMRIYARESSGAPTVGLWRSVEALLVKLVRPNSALRNTMAYTHTAPRFDRRFFVFHTARSRVEPLDLSDPWPRAWAALVATRDAARDGDVVVELVGDETQALIEQLWADLAPRIESVPAAPVAATAPTVAPARLTPFEAARRRREAFLDRGWPTSKSVGLQLGSDDAGAARRAADLRARGQLLGAWSARSRTFVHPDCQFDDAHQLRPVMRQLLALLPTKDDEGGWRRIFWLYGPRDALDGQAPADLLGTEPERVLALAREEFKTPPAAAPAPTAGAV